MALTAQQAAAEVHELLDDLAAGLTTDDDGEGRDIGDYTVPLRMTLRDCGFSAITDASTQTQERAVLNGMQYYAYLRLFRKFGARASQQQGAGASGMHLALDWSSTAKTLRMHVRECKENYEQSLAAIGRSLTEDPDLASTASQAVNVDATTEVGARLLRTYDGLPWFAEDPA